MVVVRVPSTAPSLVFTIVFIHPTVHMHTS